jgi:hypothetical protein
MGLAVGLLPLFAGNPAATMPGAVAIGGMGVGAFVFNALRLPRWVRLREQQMKDVAERTRGLIDQDPSSD